MFLEIMIEILGNLLIDFLFVLCGVKYTNIFGYRMDTAVILFFIMAVLILSMYTIRNLVLEIFGR